MLVKSQNGNSKFNPNRFKCPHCGEVLHIAKRHSMTLCGKCKKIIDGEDLIEIKE